MKCGVIKSSEYLNSWPDEQEAKRPPLDQTPANDMSDVRARRCAGCWAEIYSQHKAVYEELYVNPVEQQTHDGETEYIIILIIIIIISTLITLFWPRWSYWLSNNIRGHEL